MKYNKFLTILFASGLLGIAVACTDNFEVIPFSRSVKNCL